MDVKSASMNDEIGTLVRNRDEIARQLARDPLLNNDENNESLPVGTDAILRRENELSNELHEFTALRTVSGLIKEFKTNLQLLEFENCFYSLQALRKKLHSNSALLNRSFGLQRSVATYVDNMHLELVNTLFEALNDGFWKITEDSIAFRSTITCGEDKIELQYTDLMESVENLYFPSGRLDSKLWIMSDMVLGNLQETVRDKLDTILNEFVHISGVLHFIRTSLFATNKELSLSEDKSKLLFRDSMKTGDESIAEGADSFRNLLLFIRDTVVLRDQKIMAQKLGPLIATELVKFIKVNSPVVFQPDNSQIRDTIEYANKCLVEVSKASDFCNYDGAEIYDLFNNDQIPVNLHIDKVFQDRLKDLRQFFADRSWQRLEDITTVRGPNLPTQSPIRGKRPSSSSKRSLNGDWGWEDTEWNEHMDVDLGDKDAGSDVVSTYSKRDPNVEATDDAWDEAWDIEIEDEGPENENTSDYRSTGSEVKVTQLPGKIVALINEFDKECHAPGQKVDEFYYKHKLNVLQTTIMAIASRQYREQWWQLHIDLKYVIQRNPALTRLQELTVNNLDLFLNTRESVVYKLVGQQLMELRQNDRRCSWNTTTDQLLPYIQTKIVNLLVMLGKPDCERPLSSFLQFLYENCIVKNIMQWQVISERNSENISHFISLIYSGTEVPVLNGNPSYREYREKFAIIGKFLPLHLKDIMEMFYNGDFYLFTTDELVQWIVLLFAETPLRRSAIDDIYEIRNADVGEDE